jgi:hypothetical protein
MAIQHIATILCDYIIRADDGRTSVCGIFRNIYASSKPIVKAPIGLCVEIMGDAGDAFSVTMEGLGFNLVVIDDVVGPTEGVMLFQQPSITIGGEMGLRFEDFGIFNVVVRSGNQVIHTTPYGVVLQATQGGVDGSNSAQ